MVFNVGAIVEIPVGSKFKYEVDKRSGQLSVDRPLREALPYNYGYVPDTLYKDGDPLDVCILGKNPIVPLAKVQVEVLGVFLCDDNGECDDKLVATVVGEAFIEEEIEDYLEEVKHYLATYKPGFKVLGFVGAENALEIFEWSVDNYQNNIWNPNEQNS